MEDSNDKSSKRLNRRKLHRRLNKIVSIIFLSLSCYILFLTSKNKNTKKRKATTEEWKIKRALDIMKQREMDDVNRHKNIDVRSYHDVEEKNVKNRDKGHFGIRGNQRGNDEIRYDQHNIDHHEHNHHEYYGERRDERMHHPGHPRFERDERMHRRGDDPRLNREREIKLKGGRRVILHDDAEKSKKTPTSPPKRLNATHPFKWINPLLLPKIPNSQEDDKIQKMLNDALTKIRREGHKRADFRIAYEDEKEENKEWERFMHEFENEDESFFKPKVDYRRDVKYIYPEVIMSPPQEGGYPKLEPLSSILQTWPQDDVDLDIFYKNNKEMKEVLLHFDYSNITERNAAIKFRDRELPFKVYNIPEIDKATKKWTDEYLSQEFEYSYQGKTAHGHCQESDNNYFAFFRNNHWDVSIMGSPPTMDNDWSFKKWTKHARYADLKSIPVYERHYYWQAGAPHLEMFQGEKEDQSFISFDLPSFSSKENNFFSFHTDDQKGIQCRFGERSVTAATHYDAGRNMVAMIKGAKRYILSPPKSCPLLGIVNEKQHPIFRHSLLNFAHINLSKDQTIGMSSEEREWLQRAASAPSLSTVLNEGEVLYIPSHWFHYITSLQKSAQCNVRSGRDVEGSEEFGGMRDVDECGEVDSNKHIFDEKNIYNNHY